jgi:hypothetical protein
MINQRLQIGPFSIIQNVPIEESFVYLIGLLELDLGPIKCPCYEYVVFVVSICLIYVTEKVFYTYRHRHIIFYIVIKTCIACHDLTYLINVCFFRICCW